VYKYRKGKVQRTLKRELKVLEIVEMEGIAASSWGAWIRGWGIFLFGYWSSFRVVHWLVKGVFRLLLLCLSINPYGSSRVFTRGRYLGGFTHFEKTRADPGVHRAINFQGLRAVSGFAR